MSLRPLLRAGSTPRIGRCNAAFSVADPDGSLGSPDRLVGALRFEILPVLEQVLDQPPVSDAHADIEQLEIDLGHWPDPPDWEALQRVFAEKLRAALAPYLSSSSDVKEDLVLGHTPTPSAPAQQSSRVAESDQAFLRAVRSHLTRFPQDRETLRLAYFGAGTPADMATNELEAETIAQLSEILSDRGAPPSDPDNLAQDLWDLLPLAMRQTLPDRAFLHEISAHRSRAPHLHEKLRQALISDPGFKDALVDKCGPDALDRLQRLVSKSEAQQVAAADRTEALWQLLSDVLPTIADAPRRAWLQAAAEDPDGSATRDQLEHLHDIAASLFSRRGFPGAEAFGRAAVVTLRLASDPTFDMPQLSEAHMEQVSRDARHILAGFDIKAKSLADLKSLYRDKPGMVKQRIKERLTGDRQANLLEKLTSTPPAFAAEVTREGTAADSEPMPPDIATKPPQVSAVHKQQTTSDSGAANPAATPAPAFDPQASDTDVTSDETDAANQKAFLENPSLTASALRQHWAARRAWLNTGISALPPAQLRRLIMRLVPPGADTLIAKIKDVEGARAKTVLLAVLRAILDDRPVSFETAAVSYGDENTASLSDKKENQTEIAANRSRPRPAGADLDDAASSDEDAPRPFHLSELSPEPGAVRPPFRSAPAHHRTRRVDSAEKTADVLASLGQPVLDRLIELLLPEQADLLRDAISGLVNKTPAPDFARALMLHGLLENRSLDLEHISRQVNARINRTVDMSQPEGGSRAADERPGSTEGTTSETISAHISAHWGTLSRDTSLSPAQLRRAWEAVGTSPAHGPDAVLSNWAEQLAQMRHPTQIRPPPAAIGPTRRITSRRSPVAAETLHLLADLLRASGLSEQAVTVVMRSAEEDATAAALNEPTGEMRAVLPDGSALRQPPPQRKDFNRVAATLQTLLDVGLLLGRESWPRSLLLIWQALPSETRQRWAASKPKDNGSSGTSPDRSSEQNWRLLLDAILLEPETPLTLAEFIDHAFARLEPGMDARLQVLRLLVTRLSYAVGTDRPATRQITRAALEEVITRIATEDGSDAGEAPDPLARPAMPRQPATLLTDVAGLVLLHPFLRLLFERLDVLDGEGRIPDGSRSRAFSILQALTLSGGAPDPLHFVLLGLDGRPKLQTTELEPEATTMITGLLQSVIDQWGKLGKTSTDGLRETFLIRPGSLETRQSGTFLTVTAGPFDMLLDALPWSLGPVALPWMPSPCHVNWRSEDG